MCTKVDTNGNTPCQNIQNGLATVATVVIVAMAILMLCKVALFITGIIATAAFGLFILTCACCCIDSVKNNR